MNRDLAVITFCKDCWIVEVYFDALDHTDKEWVGALPDDIAIIEGTYENVCNFVTESFPEAQIRINRAVALQDIPSAGEAAIPESHDQPE